MKMQATLLFLAFLAFVKAQDSLCPPEVQIVPCLCQVVDDRPSVECQDINDEDELESVFSADFPDPAIQFFTLTNSYLTQISRNVFGNISFEDVLIATQYIDAISPTAFENSESTLINWEILNSPITSASFPFGSLERFTNLVQLTLRNNLLTRFPEITSESLEFLFIRDNEYVREIPENAVSDITNLVSLDLQRCAVETINNGAFQGAEQLRYLSLRENKVTELTPPLFRNLPSLEELNLSNNNLSQIHIDTFTDLPSLKALNLGYNQIHLLNFTTFGNNPSLENLVLLYNALLLIEPGTFNRNPSLSLLDIGYNGLTRLFTGTFDGLNDTFLYLDYNNLAYVESNSFGDISNSYINIQYNQLTDLYEYWLKPVLDNNNNVYVNGNTFECGCEISWLFDEQNYQQQVTGSCPNGTYIANLDPEYYQNNC